MKVEHQVPRGDVWQHWRPESHAYVLGRERPADICWCCPKVEELDCVKPDGTREPLLNVRHFASGLAGMNP